MTRLKWGEGSEPPRLRKSVQFERFLKAEVKSIWLLGDVVVRGSHYQQAGGFSRPCLLPDDCPFCQDATMRAQIEGYIPCLMLTKKEQNFWVPTIAVFTKGALTELGEGPHRGRRLEMKRVQVGTSKRLTFTEKAGIEPDVPTFDPRPFLELLWFPLQKPETMPAVPDPIPAGEARGKYIPAPEMPGEAERAKIRAMLAQHGLGKTAQTAEPETPSNTQNANKRDLGHDRPQNGTLATRQANAAPAQRQGRFQNAQRPELPTLGDVLGSALGSVLGEQGSPVVHDETDGFEVPVTQDDIENTPTGTIIGREVKARLDQHQARQGKGGAA